MIADSPFAADLNTSITALYDLAPARVSRRLQVCLCPVCMTVETRDQIIATPVRDLSPDLIQEYSSSAHGVPDDLDDLRAVLPRYLDLMAQDEEVDKNGVGADLLRFGQARDTCPAFPGPALAAAMDDWARAAILHFGWLQAGEQDFIETPLYLVETLLVGGWPVTPLTDAMDSLFALPDRGDAALAWVLHDLGARLRHGRLDFWALAQYRPDVAASLVDWLNGLLGRPQTARVLSDPALAPEIAALAAPLPSLAGQITPEMLG